MQRNCGTMPFPMSDPSAAIDLAHAENWFGFRPGMMRAQVLAGLEKLGVEETEYDEEYVTAGIGEQEIEFWFEKVGEGRMRQVSLDGSATLWNGRPLIGARVDDALSALSPWQRAPMWQAVDVIGDPFPPAERIPAGPLTDEQLLEQGTIWLPDRSLGLVVGNGLLIAVAWREARDLPAQFAGPVTDAQRQLSKRPDLESYLREKHASGFRAATPKDPLAPLHTALVLICIAMLALIGKKGFQEMQLWSQAPVLSGKFVSLEEVPRKKFLDLAPEALRRWMPEDPRRNRELYRVTYLDPSGRRQVASLEHGEFYAPPREPGEEVQVAYVEGDPPRVKGLSRARDSAFLECLPLAIGVGVLYFVAWGVIYFLPGLLRLVARAGAPGSRRIDTDHPVLR